MRLPYTIQPKAPEIVEIGDESTGKLKLLKFGYIREREQREFEAIDLQQAEAQKFTLDLAKKIADAKNVPIDAVLTLLDDPVQLTTALIEYGEAGDIDRLQAYNRSAKNQRLERITVMIRERVCDDKGTPLVPEWTITDTIEELQDSRLLAAIEEFIAIERGGALGESPKASKPRSSK